MSLTRFSDVGLAPQIQILVLEEKFREDPYESKINLGLSAFITEEGGPLISNTFYEVQKTILNDDTLDKDCLPPLGLESFTTQACCLLLGKDSVPILDGKAFGVQVLGGHAGIRVAAEIFKNILGCCIIYLSDPCWSFYHLVLNQVGFDEIRTYRYWCHTKKAIDFAGMKEDLKNAPENSVVCFYAVGHNPVGLDLEKEQWKEIADVMEAKNLVPFFDCVYVGIVSGNWETDSWPVRYFASRNLFLMALQSFTYAFCLYNESTANLMIVTPNEEEIQLLKSEIAFIIKDSYAAPPGFGARVVAHMLNNANLVHELRIFTKSLWTKFNKRRSMLREHLEKIATPGDLSFISRQKGVYVFMGLNSKQIDFLREKYHIYVLPTGRISLCAITNKNVEYVAKALREALLNKDLVAN